MARRDGIAEILQSGRFPGFTVRGGTRAPLAVDYAGGLDGTEANPQRRREIDAKIWREKKATADERRSETRSSRKKDGAIRHIGSTPFEVHKALESRYGDDFRGAGRKEILRREGWMFDKKE